MLELRLNSIGLRSLYKSKCTVILRASCRQLLWRSIDRSAKAITPFTRFHSAKNKFFSNDLANSSPWTNRNRVLYLVPLVFVANADFNGDSDSETSVSELVNRSIAEQEQARYSNNDTVFGKLSHILTDHVLEPLRTLCRFIHLSTLFIPLLLLYPITFIGARREAFHGERNGAILYYDLLAWILEHAGPSFIKLGQWAASRKDIFSPYMCENLSKLHSNNKPHSFDYTRKIIEETIKCSLEEYFFEFPTEPLGVGAIAQVYLATLKENKKQVAVKVLHPRVRRIVDRDLSVMRFFACLINAIPTMEWLSLPGEVDTFKTMMMLQLDLRIEASNLERFRENFKDKHDVSFPKPYFSTVRLLVEEYINAVPLESFLSHRHQETHINKEIADKGLTAFLKMLLLDNFVHSDLHPGNIFVRFYKTKKSGLILKEHEHEDRTIDVQARLDGKSDRDWKQELDKLHNEGYKVQICFIDAGLVTELNQVNRRNFLDLFKAISIFDGYRVGELMIERSRTPSSAINGDVFALKVERLVNSIKKRTFALGNMTLGDLLSKTLTMVRQHHIRMESDFITVVLSILLLEGIGRQLDPDLDILNSAVPILRQLPASDTLTLNDDTLSMLKISFALEVRQIIHASIQDIHNLVKYDRLSPNQ